MTEFDYSGKIWGGSILRLSPTCLAYLKLKYCLEDLGYVKGKVIDVGCGGGGFTKSIKFYRPDLEIYGVDINVKAIQKAKRDSQGVKFLTSSVYHLPFQKNYFDGAILTDVLEHLENPLQALTEVERVLKPGGYFHLFLPLEGEFFTLYFFLDKLGWKAKENLAGHIQKLTWRKLEKLFANSNFRVIKKRFSGHCFGQVVDVGFFTFCQILNIRLATGFEEHLLSKSQILRLFKNFATLLVNFESFLLKKIPGSGVHVLIKAKI